MERIKAGAFSRTIRENQILCLRGHDASKAIGRTPETLSLSEGAEGLTSEIRLVYSPLSREVLSDVRSKIAKGLYIAFVPLSELWTTKAGTVVRELLEVDLQEISVVDRPAYPQTTIGERSYQQFCEMRSAHPEICEATVDRGRFVPGRAVVCRSSTGPANT